MGILLNPYLSFKGNAREAIEFYHSVFGGTLDINTYAESSMPHSEGEGQKIMHAQLNGDDGIVLMASDSPESMPFTPGSSVSVSLSGDNEETLRGYFEKLSQGGTVAMPLTKADWGDMFGMVTDKFGTYWMVNISAKE